QFNAYYDKYQSIYTPLYNDAQREILEKQLTESDAKVLRSKAGDSAAIEFETFLTPPQGYVVVKTAEDESARSTGTSSSTVKEVDRKLTVREYEDLKRFQRVDLDGIYTLLPFATRHYNYESWVKFSE